MKNFSLSPKCRLISPAENKLGRVAKIILEIINKSVREKLHYKQCKNPSNVINWSQHITETRNCIFIQLDIEEFYPSKTKHLTLKAIQHAKLYTSITQQQLDIDLHVRKSLVFSKLSVCLSVCLSACLSVCLSVCRYVRTYVCM